MLNDFFLIGPQDNGCTEKIFETLKSVVDFDSAYIYFDNPMTLKYSCTPDTVPLSKICEDLKIKNTVFGKLVITKNAENFYSPKDKELFKTCSLIISNIIKDIELSQIINMQVNTLQEGIIEKNREYKRIVKADKIKNEFLNHISHELRTPLNSIIGFSESLSSGIFGTLNPKQKEYIDEIRLAGLQLLGMINEVLDMSKIEAGAMKFTPVNLNINTIVTEVINILRPLAEKKSIAILNNTTDQTIFADYQKLQQILFNIIGNSVKFTPSNGKITIAADIIDDKIHIDVKDTGIGIPKKYHKKIFKKFEQVNQSENSTGLGLAITKELIKMHGGSITLESAEGTGSTFTIILPLMHD